MTATEFNKLSFAEKGNIWSTEAVFLDERVVYARYKVLMYSYANFYIEVYYNAKNNEIETLKALENVDDWEGYLKSINLELLY